MNIKTLYAWALKTSVSQQKIHKDSVAQIPGNVWARLYCSKGKPGDQTRLPIQLSKHPPTSSVVQLPRGSD